MGVQFDKSEVNDKSSVNSKQANTCTWKELALHNTEDDCWVAVDGKVYDVSEWLNKHPGGKDIILMSSGRDVTNLFQSYHPLTDKPSQVLKKYYKCDISNTEFPRYVSKSPFYDTLRNRLKTYFAKNNLDPQSSWKIYTRIFATYAILFATFYLTHFTNFFNSTFLSIIFAIIFGCAEALFGMHILHDSCHAAVSHSPMLWRWMGSTFDYLIGGSYFSWIHQHVLGHHIYTNVRNADPDLGEGEVDFRRVSPYQRREWYHRWQHIYAPLLYCLLSVKYRVQDLDVFTKRLNGQIRVGPAPLFYFVSYFVGKTTFLFWRLCIPMLFSSQSIAKIIGLFIVTEIVHGYYLTINFQVSHVASGLEFMATPPPPAANSEINEDWAILQVKTTQDYAHGDPITAYLTGGLNYQVVHHLFPSISQTYYPAIAPIVVETCKEYGIPYMVLPNFISAVWSHISYLRDMGLPSAPVLSVPVTPTRQTRPVKHNKEA
eukprot:TRINITY_DN141_c0_g1_i4.p1 TRINITY_DN141_c0_g1~~TRINITY_DN141_c0_g1_i4.p1  ORF type:complete len:487 (-),score=90.18 TRINITY_DN141_c0_g1_i4:261-1721(-)